MKIEKKNIWITGASSGLGRALAIELSKFNTKLILSSRNVIELEKVKEICEKNSSKCFVQVIDLQDASSIKEAVGKVLKEFPKIDILVNNGGISQRAFAHETSLEVDRKIMEINYFGAVELTKAVLPSMIKNRVGHIVAVSSISGKFGFPLRSAYAASKFAMQGFFETLFFELKQFNINVTMVFPGRILTNVSQNALTKDGEKYGKLDEGQAAGMSAEDFAKKMIKAIRKNKKEVLIGKAEIIMVHLHRFFPFIFNKIVNKIKPT